MKINIAWLRRDLRLDDNTALNRAIAENLPVLVLFIFDSLITEELKTDDPRISFIYRELKEADRQLRKKGGGIKILKGDPLKIWKEIASAGNIANVFVNRDYEPYAIERDKAVGKILEESGSRLISCKDQVIFESREITKSDGEPYTVFTPYSRKWIQEYEYLLARSKMTSSVQGKNNLAFPGKIADPGVPFPSLRELGFVESPIRVREFDLSAIKDYDKYRNFPAADRTTYLSPHLRFGTVSIRTIAAIAYETERSFLNELIWREFFMQILSNYPHVVTGNFRKKYDDISWRNDEKDFLRWCDGETGYPIVDAGMRQLNMTGYMHNRVRMITAGFLCKHLLTDWRWGEAYFAEKLLDYELSSNNGNWQWAAGTGCDAAPYFRIFSPDAQEKRFDPGREYINRWIEDIDKSSYPKPLVENEFARLRALEAYRAGIRET